MSPRGQADGSEKPRKAQKEDKMTHLKIVCATCKKHLSGPVDAAPTEISHGICVDCLRRDHPGAYFFGKRRALRERLAMFDAGQGIADLNGFFFAHGKEA